MYIEKYDLHVRFQLMNVHVYDSYKVTDESCIMDAILIIKETKIGSHYKRSAESWLHEWVAHNCLYRHNMQPERTGSVDLNDDECLLKRLGYFCIYILDHLDIWR